MEWFTGQLGEPFLFLLAALASWRLTAMVAYESGPLAVFDSVRRWMARLRLGRLVACFHCLGVWMAAAMALAVYGFRPATMLLWLAITAVVSIFERWLVGGGMGESDDG
ncbi:MAG: DUF1360 domain-containing protein [Acidimicrobiia bacterium]|jgi:hypothetical protein